MAPPQLQPGPLAVFHQGIQLAERNAGTTESAVSESAFNANPLPQVFPPFDFANVVLLVVGLLVLVTSCLGLTGEREAGTLDMLLTHGVTSRALVMAKWLSNGITAGTLLLLAMAVAVIAAAVSGVHLTFASVDVFILSAFCSVLFLLCLAALGTLLSSLSVWRAQSIVGAIALWMLITIILPSSCAYTAASAAPLKDLGEKKRAIDRILTDDREASLNNRIAKLYEKDNPELDRYLRPAGLSAERFRGLPDSEADSVARKLAAGDKAFAAFIAAEQSKLIDIVETTWNEHADRAEVLESDLQTSINRQNNLILLLTAFFPRQLTGKVFPGFSAFLISTCCTHGRRKRNTNAPQSSTSSPKPEVLAARIPSISGWISEIVRNSVL